MKREVFIISAVRTPIGKFKGSLSGYTSFCLGAQVIREALVRGGICPELLDEVILGNILSVEPRGNPAREAVLKAGLPHKVQGYTINMNCGSGLKAINLATIMIKKGESETIVAGGMESMSRVPYGIYGLRTGVPMGHIILHDLLLDGLEGMGMTAERLANRYDIKRDEQDFFALRSQQLASLALELGKFQEQIIPISIETKKGLTIFSEDEGIKPDTIPEGLACLKPIFLRDGTVTAGNSSTISDGAAAVVLMGEERVRELGIRPLARIVSWAEAGVVSETMGIGIVPAIKLALQKAGLNLIDIDLFELNESFAAHILAVLKELEIDLDKVNVNGGAIALGHPVGASGAILIVKLLHELIRRGMRRGLAALCIGEGQGIATIIEIV